MDLSVLFAKEHEFSGSNKIYIKDNQFKVGHPEEGAISDLFIVAEKLRSEIKNNNSKTEFLLKNLKNFNVKIEKRNKLQKNIFLKIYDFFLKSFWPNYRKEPQGFFPELLNLNDLEHRLSVTSSTAPPSPKAEENREKEEVDPHLFEGRIKQHFELGPIFAMSRKLDSLLAFDPEAPQISRKKRAAIAAKAVFLAPSQPEGRAFEYVGFATGRMRQDLYQILGLIEQGISPIHVSLIDPEYGQTNKIFYPTTDLNACAEQLRQAIAITAPKAEVIIDLFPSASEWQKKSKDSSIDLLSAVRVETTHPDLTKDLELLKGKLSENSLSMVVDVKNRAEVLFKRNGQLELEFEDAMKFVEESKRPNQFPEERLELYWIAQGCLENVLMTKGKAGEIKDKWNRETSEARVLSKF